MTALNISLKGTQVYWLTQMMEGGLISDQACTLIIECLPSISSSNSESEDSDTELNTEYMKFIFPM